MATKQFKLELNGAVALDIKISGSSDLVDDFVKQNLMGTFGAFDKLKAAVVKAGEQAIEGKIKPNGGKE